MAASETALGGLHDAVAKVLTEALKGTPLPSYTDPETEELVEGQVIPPSAAILAVATKFLKDNNITCAPSEDNAVGELQRQMEERRRQRRAPNSTDLKAASEQAGFMSGLH